MLLKRAKKYRDSSDLYFANQKNQQEALKMFKAVVGIDVFLDDTHIHLSFRTWLKSLRNKVCPRSDYSIHGNENMFFMLEHARIETEYVYVGYVKPIRGKHKGHHQFKLASYIVDFDKTFTLDIHSEKMSYFGNESQEYITGDSILRLVDITDGRVNLKSVV